MNRPPFRKKGWTILQPFLPCPPMPARPPAPRLLLVVLLLTGLLSASASADAPPVQLVSARRYYTLFLSTPSRPGEAVHPRIRYQGVWDCVNWGADEEISLFQQEPAHLPYLEFRAKANGVPIPVEKREGRYWVPLHFSSGQRVRVEIESLQQVLPVDPSRKIDSFEDLIQPTGWRPPVVNYWIVVDLGRLFGAFLAHEGKSPAFGLSPSQTGPGAPPPDAFPQFLANKVLQVAPGGYRIEGSKIWWYYHNLGDPASSPALGTLRVVWQAWYR